MSPLFHVVLSADMPLPAPPERVLPLLCPVREAEWLPGWRARVLHSRSGLAELGCVFTTQAEGEPPRVWTITRHAPDGVQFVQFVADRCVIRLDIHLAAADGGTLARWTYEVAALEEGHEAFFAAYAEAPFRERMARLADGLRAACAEPAC